MLMGPRERLQTGFRMGTTNVRNKPKVEIASTRVRPCVSPNVPHQPVVSAESVPIVTVIII